MAGIKHLIVYEFQIVITQGKMSQLMLRVIQV